MPTLEINEARSKTPLHRGFDRPARRQLDIVGAEFVDGSRLVVDDLVDGTRGRDGEIAGHGPEIAAFRIDPNSCETFFLAQADRLARAFQDDDDVVFLAWPAGRIEDRTEQQQLLSDEALAHLHLVLRHFGHQHRIALSHQHEGGEREESRTDHSGDTVKISSGR